MCKVEILKALLNRRLSAAVEEIFGLFARTIAEYEEELCRTKGENERQRRLLNAVLRPRDESHTTDVIEEPPNVKKEEEETNIAELPVTPVSLKIEDDRHCPLAQTTWPQPPTNTPTETDGNQHAEPTADTFSTLPPKHDDRTLHPESGLSQHINSKHFKCPQCDKTFGTKYTLTRHMKSHTASKEHWKCSQCGRTLGDRRNLRRHMMVHTGEKPFLCTICGKRFSQKTNLMTHTRTHTGEKPFSCSLCGKRFGDRSALIQHKKTHNGRGNFAYSAYNPGFNIRPTLGQHMRTYTGQKPSVHHANSQQVIPLFSLISAIKCAYFLSPCLPSHDYVGKMCKVEMLKALLNARLNTAVEEVFVVFARTIADYEEELSRSKQENERQRQLLHTVFRPRYEAHSAEVSGEVIPPEQLEWKSMVEQQDPEPLHYLEEEVADTYQVKKEEDGERLPSPKMQFPYVVVKSEYNEDNNGSTSSQRMTIEGDGSHCGASRADNCFASLSAGADEHSKCDNPPWKCSQCDKTFGTKYTLRVHVKLHSGVKPFMCSVCGKRFSQKAHLTTHTRIHTGDKPFSCAVCTKSFIDNSAMIKHTRIHTGEKPFACLVCSLTFSDRSNLGKHMRRHTGEKPFACSLCGKRFSIRGRLITHNRTHTGEKPFTCNLCGLSFSDRSGLAHHTRTHMGQKRFSCSVCGKQFSQRGAFTKHMLVHAGEENDDSLNKHCKNN
ncbi:zinc finger protein 250-like [Corythoichthys intestinalis]|uniref:zinc finger protein 250-like n=1 Tax=Corythoichthys intestinalis TaxID=161448 RepID=UPI0025A52AC1|nr:zinc finger protein 250-like [Corythoichthys intestinalis]